jgi:hypothetical protein
MLDRGEARQASIGLLDDIIDIHGHAHGSLEPGADVTLMRKHFARQPGNNPCPAVKKIATLPQPVGLPVGGVMHKVTTSVTRS